MSESVGSSEFLWGIEEYLRYIAKDSQANSVHTLARTMSLENKKESSVKAFMQDFGGQIQDSDRDIADLLHGTVKAETIVDSHKTLLHFLGKTLSDQLIVDLIFGIIKSTGLDTTYRVLAQYVAKNIADNQDLVDLIYSIIKSTNSESTYKALLHYIAKQNISIDAITTDLIFGIIKTPSTVSAYKPLLQYINKKSDDKNLQDLIHGSIKSDDLMIAYKAVLQYTGRSVTTNKSMADLALAIQRSIDSDNFEDDFIKAHLAMLDRQFLDDKIFRGINNCIKSNVNRAVINDAFSRSQLRSKIWLIEELDNIRKQLGGSPYKNVAIFAGWFGQLKAIYDKILTYRKMRIVEIDKSACEISDYNFNLSELENYKVKSVHADITELTLHKNGYEWPVENFKDGTTYNEKFLPDLIINTSAEHMGDQWFFQLKHKELDSSPIVAIQSNNLFDIPEHINCVYSTEHMKKKFPMREILYEGELQLKGYKRVMLIGRP